MDMLVPMHGLSCFGKGWVGQDNHGPENDLEIKISFHFRVHLVLGKKAFAKQKSKYISFNFHVFFLHILEDALF